MKFLVTRRKKRIMINLAMQDPNQGFGGGGFGG